MYLEIILEIIIICLGLYLAFIKSYFKERGKILATKKDIDEITAKVELIKSKFTVLTHSRTTLNVEKRNSYLIFYDKYFLWLNILLNSTNGNLNCYNSREIDDYLKIIDSKYMELNNAEARMKLWNDNSELIKIIRKLKISTLKNLQNKIKFGLLDINEINLKLKSPTPSSSITSTSYHKSEYSELNGLLDDIEKRGNQITDDLLNEYKKLISLINLFIEKSREYLLEIS